MAETHESVLAFACEGEWLTGVLAEGVADRGCGVLIVVGGPQYRAGSHRSFVQLARHLAQGGYPTLRFDVRGMGDSGGDLRSFEQLGADLNAALTALLAARPQLRGVVLWGLCDGASAALLKLQSAPDPRVAGLCLVNPWVRSGATLARTQLKHYYRQRLMQKSFWRKLLSGQVAGRALREFGQSLRSARTPGAAAPQSFQQRMAAGLAGFRGPVLVLLSSEDYTAKEFSEHTRGDPTWQSALRRAEQRPLHGTDHTCSDAAGQRLLERETLAWLDRTLGARA
jgi:uncharacterized protein